MIRWECDYCGKLSDRMPNADCGPTDTQWREIKVPMLGKRPGETEFSHEIIGCVHTCSDQCRKDLLEACNHNPPDKLQEWSAEKGRKPEG